MQRVEMLYLSQEDILQIGLPLKEVISLVESGLREHGQGLVENPPKPGIHSKVNSFIHAMPAYFHRLGIGGIKWVSGYPDNRRLCLPRALSNLFKGRRIPEDKIIKIKGYFGNQTGLRELNRRWFGEYFQKFWRYENESLNHTKRWQENNKATFT